LSIIWKCEQYGIYLHIFDIVSLNELNLFCCIFHIIIHSSNCQVFLFTFKSLHFHEFLFHLFFYFYQQLLSIFYQFHNILAVIIVSCLFKFYSTFMDEIIVIAIHISIGTICFDSAILTSDSVFSGYLLFSEAFMNALKSFGVNLLYFGNLIKFLNIFYEQCALISFSFNFCFPLSKNSSHYTFFQTIFNQLRITIFLSQIFAQLFLIFSNIFSFLFHSFLK